MTKVLLIGCKGQVGKELKKILSDGKNLFTTSLQAEPDNDRHFQLDLTNEDQLRSLIRHIKPDYLINAAAYTAVDRAEDEHSLALAINTRAVEVMAEELKNWDGLLVHYSTDYVYDGLGEHFRTESEPTKPINFYGYSKLKGEEAIKEVGVPHYIFRTSWVFSAEGHNFVKAMLRLGSEREVLQVVNDQIGSPTSARLLALATKKVLTAKRSSHPNKTYHLCCSGITSWHGFAEEIFRLAKEFGFALKVQHVKKILSADYPTPARRPLNSRLNCQAFERDFNFNRPCWKDELVPVLQEITNKN